MRLLWIPHISWRIPQRAHAFCNELAKRHEVHVVCHENFGRPSAYFSRRYIANFMPRISREPGGITVHWAPHLAPTFSLAPLRHLNQRLFAATVQRVIDGNDIDVVIGSYPCPLPRAPKLIFDLYDDNIAYAHERGLPKQAIRDLDAAEHAWMASADHVVAASSVIAERRCPSAKVIPTGVDLAAYRAAQGDAVRKRIRVNGKLLGFISAQDRWVELRRVLLAAKNYPAHAFLIGGTGPALPLGEAYAARHQLSNVTFVGHVPYLQLPAYCKALDIGLCPYAKTPGRDAGFSMKLLSYTAGGAVVVSTALESIRRLRFPNVLLVPDEDQAFISGIGRALRARYRRPRNLAAYDLRRVVRTFERLLH